MALTDAQIIELKTEIDNDSKVLGYSGKTDQEVAALMNTVGLSNETIDRGVIDAHEIVSACVSTDLNALSDKQQAQLLFVVSAGQVNTSDAKIRAIFGGLFNGTQTKTNLLTLATRPASRAEVLFGEEVKYWDVARARAL